ncbi:MAG: peptidylprolyl isomerase [Nostoc sp.]|uniref:peptidylprolyl isomerase n=1 Tax=Nostoc sp. TaxID=1180 RepID=UPI002FF902D7
MSQTLTVTTNDIIQYIKYSWLIPGVLEAIATQKIIADTANQAGITVTEQEIQQEGDRLRFVKKLVRAEDTWDWLKKHHLSLKEFEDLITTTILSSKLAEHLFSHQVETIFYQNQLDYIAAVTYEVILEDSDLALELFYAIQQGEITFPEIARQYILNPELRRIGGYQGIRRRRDFRAEIAPVVFAAEPPQVLKPISTSKGVYLIWVDEIIQPNLDEELRQQLINNLFAVWLHHQVEKTEIHNQLDIGDVISSVSPELLKQA